MFWERNGREVYQGGMSAVRGFGGARNEYVTRSGDNVSLSMETLAISRVGEIESTKGCGSIDEEKAQC